MAKALTCPFCGSIPKLVFRKTFNEYFVSCTNPSCQTICGRVWGSKLEEFKFISHSETDAINKWNTSIERTEVDIIRINI